MFHVERFFSSHAYGCYPRFARVKFGIGSA